MSRVLFALGCVFVLLFAFTATAFAQAAAPAVEVDWDLAKPIYDAIVHGQYAFAGAMVLVVAVALFRKYAPGRAGAFATSSAGGALLTLIGSFGTALAAALSIPGASISWALTWTATTIAVGAAGGYVLIKNILVDPLLASQWYADKAPAWLKAALGVVLWIFTKPDLAAKADKAGAAAVAASPGKGPKGTIGEPTDVD